MSECDTPQNLPQLALQRAQANASERGHVRIPARMLRGFVGKKVRHGGDTAGEQYGPGFPRTISGAGASRRDPALAGSALQSVLQPFSKEITSASIAVEWGHIVGRNIAEHSEVESLHKGVLTIRAHSTAWGTQLRMLIPALMRQINDHAGDSVVSQLIVLGPHTPSWKKGRLSVPGRGPRDTYG